MKSVGMSIRWTLFVSTVFCFGSTSIHADEFEWMRGGDLHSATVDEWKIATPENKLSTVADWLSSTVWKGKLTSPSAFLILKEKAKMLADAVDGAVADQEKIGSMKVSEIAAAILVMANDLGPD